MFTKYIWFVLCPIDMIVSKMEPFMVGGGFASINRFPHSAFLGVNCSKKNGGELYWICGGSIVNQAVVLTAAHCVAGCSAPSHISVTVGYEDKEGGVVSSVSSFIIHEHYDPDLTIMDIALLKLKTKLTFSVKVKRVALMKDPPYHETAMVAGWGLVDEKNRMTSNFLKFIEQKVWPNEQCKARVKTIPKGCFCASSQKDVDYASRGDSGSALMVRGFIQIGLVSYKMPAVAKNLIVYTDVGHYFEWIQENTERLFC